MQLSGATGRPSLLAYARWDHDGPSPFAPTPMPSSKTPPWKKPNPRGQRSQPLSSSQKAAAKQRAEENGRPYPNLVDNMWAARLPRDASSSGTAKSE
ncbi:hypothetical protein NB697_002901 [Xanthomonas sacchari]|nr:hypothetical protein [Xanthomonas sacchari]